MQNEIIFVLITFLEEEKGRISFNWDFSFLTNLLQTDPDPDVAEHRRSDLVQGEGDFSSQNMTFSRTKRSHTVNKNLLL